MISRRTFLRLSGAGFITTFLSNPFARALAATASPAHCKSLVVIFQRGAADGLSMVPPLGDSQYHEYRPTLALKENGEGAALRLDGFFGLHPSLSDLLPFWSEGTLAVIHQAGFPEATRSHFESQDFLESGSPGNKAVEDGFLNRALHYSPRANESEIRAVAIPANLPRMLWGKYPALAMESIKEFASGGGLRNHASGREDLYPNGPLSKHLREIALLIKSDMGLQIGVTDCGGWDTHVNQGAAEGQLAARLKEFGEAIAAFARDLGPKLADVVVVTVTEFGRTARENGTRGTDHGHGSVMFVLGGAVKGKRVIAKWKGLKDRALFEGRDLPVVHDYRDVFAEVLTRHLGMASLGTVFPHFDSSRGHWAEVLRG